MHHLYSAHDLLLGNVFLMSLLLFFMGVMLYLICSTVTGLLCTIYILHMICYLEMSF